MMVAITNTQREVPVRMSRMAKFSRCVIRQLSIRTPGTLWITFINARRMRLLNKRFLQHDRRTDVLSFRYDGEPVVGEILVAPREAQAYARAHGLPYEEELARYVAHGVLHWLGHEDRTHAQQRTMRAMEDQLLCHCLHS